LTRTALGFAAYGKGSHVLTQCGDKQEEEMV
jgi:hypothetical protein